MNLILYLYGHVKRISKDLGDLPESKTFEQSLLYGSKSISYQIQTPRTDIDTWFKKKIKLYFVLLDTHIEHI